MTNEQLHQILQHVVLYGRAQFEFASSVRHGTPFETVNQNNEAVKQFTKIRELLTQLKGD